VLLGKQTVDGDSDEVAQRLAGLLDWPQATFTSKIREVATGQLEVEREVDGGLQRLALTLPAVVSVELRIVSPLQVHSQHTPTEHRYPPGVRFASLPSIMQSKRKPLDCVDLADLTEQPSPQLRFVRYHPPVQRKPGRRVSSVDELARLLRTEAKVL
jgi:electron transfer flavoprotein beta subunit